MITELTEQQEKDLIEYRDKWFGIGTNTDPADFEKAEEVITWMYKEINYEKPIFVHVPSPVVGNLYINFMTDDSLWERIDKQLSQFKDMVSTIVQDNASQAADMYCGLMNTAEQLLLKARFKDVNPKNETKKLLNKELHQRVVKCLNDIFGVLTAENLKGFDEKSESVLSVQDLLKQLIKSVKQKWNYTLKNANMQYHPTWMYGQHDAYWIAFYKFCNHIGVEYTEEQTGLLEKWADLAQCCMWWWPFDTHCVVCDRPQEIHLNAEHLLHKDGGMAVKFRDGWGVWSLNGVSVSQEVAETPAEEYDCKLMLKETNAEVRREIVRKVGLSKICDDLNAQVIDEVDNYQLLMLDLGDGNNRPFLKMLNPSIHTWHIEGVSPECLTVAQALEFRNGTDVTPLVLT